MPVMQLLAGLVQTSGEPAAADGGAGRDRALRLALLVGTTAIALAVPDFAPDRLRPRRLNIAFSQLLPPLLHLRLDATCEWRRARAAPPTSPPTPSSSTSAAAASLILLAANLAALRSR